MKCKLIKTISYGSVLIAVFISAWYLFDSGFVGLQGAAWVLGVLGAPATFFCFLTERIGLTGGILSSYLLAVSLYLLQYQIISFLIYIQCRKDGELSLFRLIFYSVIVFIIIISGKIMHNIIIGSSLKEQIHLLALIR